MTERYDDIHNDIHNDYEDVRTQDEVERDRAEAVFRDMERQAREWEEQGAEDCPHGLAAWLCTGPQHY